jgi:flotillin
MKALALAEAGGAYLDLKKLELAPELTAQVALALQNSQFVNFGTSGGAGGDHSALSTGSDDVLRVVQTLMAAQVVGGSFGNGGGNGNGNGARPPAPPGAAARRGS